MSSKPTALQDGPAFWVNGKEIAHFEGPAIDIRLTREGIRERRSELRADPRVRLRRSGSDWVEVTYTSPDDDDFVIDPVGAAAAHRPPPGAMVPPPPTGSAWPGVAVSTDDDRDGAEGAPPLQRGLSSPLPLHAPAGPNGPGATRFRSFTGTQSRPVSCRAGSAVQAVPSQSSS